MNYLGYTLWRTGLTLASVSTLANTNCRALRLTYPFQLQGSVGAAIAQALFQGCFFIGFSIPDLDGAMTKKYGGQWEQYKRDVPYAFIPGVY